MKILTLFHRSKNCLEYGFPGLVFREYFWRYPSSVYIWCRVWEHLEDVEKSRKSGKPLGLGQVCEEVFMNARLNYIQYFDAIILSFLIFIGSFRNSVENYHTLDNSA